MAEELWVFGYGSVIWKHAEVAHTEKTAGFIEGFVRRFWQASEDHRGTAAAPGRVASVYSRRDYEALRIEHDDERRVRRAEGWAVHGVAFRVSAEHRDEVMRSLAHRERGGYSAAWVRVFAQGERGAPKRVVVARALTFVASTSNALFAGFAPNAHIAAQIRRSHGASGSNVEYLHKLHHALAAMGRVDAHVAALYALTR